MTTVTLTGSGNVGEVSSWTVTEAVAPAVAGDPTPSVGSVSVTAAKTDDSKYATNNALTLDVPDAGSIEATVSDVSLTAASATLAGTTVLQRFNADFPIQPAQGGTMRAAVDQLMQLSGSQYCTLTYPTGRYWSLQGHSAGFDVNNDLVEYSDQSGYTIAFNSGLSTTYVKPALVIDGGLVADTFAWNGSRRQYYATNIDGNGMDFGVGTNQHLMFKLDPSVSAQVILAGGPDDSNTSTGFYLVCEYSQPSDRLQITGYARVGGLNTAINVTGTATGFSITDEMQLVIYPRFTTGLNLAITMSLVSTTNYAVVNTLSTNISTVQPQYFTPWIATGRIRGVYQANLTANTVSTLIGANYEVTDRGYTSTSSDVGPGANGLNSPIGGRVMNGWDYLNQVATARRCEVSASGGDVVLRSRGSLAPIDLPTGDISGLQISSTASGLSVDVTVYENAVVAGGAGPTNPMPNVLSSIIPLSSGILYDAEDAETTWTVEANERKTIRVSLGEASAQFVLNPYPSLEWNDPSGWLTAKGVTEFGTYVVSGSDNLPINPQQWLDYGGSVSAKVSDDPRFVELTFVGPSPIPGVNSPYSFSISDGSTNYPSLTIAGRGIISSTSTLNILTGASNTTNAIAATVDNIAVGSIEQAHDVGGWAAAKAAGSWQTISFSIPTVNLISWNYTPPSTLVSNGAFGFSAGSLFRLEDAILRVDSVNIGRVNSTVNATYYTTVGDFDPAWAGQDYADFDALWSGFDFSDAKISPLRT